MPKIPGFDPSVDTYRLQAASQRQKTGAAEAITARANAQLVQGITSAGNKLQGSYQNHLKAQDESDMVKTRAAFLRMQKDEDHAMQQTADPAEIKKINEAYKQKYESITSGNDTFGRPRFRNNSGKESFKRDFSDNFHLRRDLSAKDKGFQLDRRNTRAGFLNGIKSARDSNYYDQPSAAAETVEYVDKLVENGFLTENEGVEKRQNALRDLDVERAGRKLSEINGKPEPDFDGTGAMNPVGMHVEQTKEYINNLENITDEQKKVFTKKADSILSNAQNATKAATKERGIQIEIKQKEYQTDAMIEVYEGKRTLSSIFHDPEISQKYKEGKLSVYAKRLEKHKAIFEKENKTLKDKTKANELQLGYDIENSQTFNMVLNYDAAMDTPQGTHKFALLDRVNNSLGMNEKTRTDLRQMIKDSDSMPTHIKDSKDNHIKDFNRILGLTDESFKAYEDIEIRENETYFDAKKAVIDPKTGVKTVDGLSEFKRISQVNRAMMQYGSLMRAGKEKEAEDYITEVKMKYEKSEDDAKLYNSFFTETKRYK